MKLDSAGLRLSATDLSNHLACRHLTSLDVAVARGELREPEWRAPDLVVIQELGLRHEAAYLKSLEDSGLMIADLRDIKSERRALQETHTAMQSGADVIAQASIASGRWFGRADILRKVPRASFLGLWSYEVYDCKLARETKAATILQLALYSAILAQIQGPEPEFMYVVPAGRNFEAESYRFAEYAAYYRHIKARLEKVCDAGEGRQTYPEPCAHCDVCRWFQECNARRRSDDHLSLVAGITRHQRNQFTQWDAATTAKLAAFPIPLAHKPARGSRESHERAREQARVQVEARTKGPVYEVLPVAVATGLCTLPAPSPGDVFLDLEGDPFAADGGLEYLFGFVASHAGSEPRYEKRWALTADQEKQAFEWLVDRIMSGWERDPALHIYHFGAHEPGKLKWLMGRYATREDQIDRMLRATLFVDLHTILKQTLRASVEEYSLKAVEVFYAFQRKVPLADSREAMRFVEHWLELAWDEALPERFQTAIERYNEDDCRSAALLRDWLEAERCKLAAAGAAIPRPALGDGAPPEEVDERQKRVATLAAELVQGIPVNPAERSGDQAAQWLLAQLLDWHRRENKAAWWEGYRLAALDDEQLLDERVGLSGLRFVRQVAIQNHIPVDRYAFEKQETEVRCEKDLYHRGEKIGSVVAVDLPERTVDIKKTRKTAGIHPTSLYIWDQPYRTDAQADALFRIGEWVRDNGVDAPGEYRAARDLLLRNPPRLERGQAVHPRPGEGPVETACRIAAALRQSVFAIQGPPGSGKTYSGARMICRLIQQGKRIGVTALSHKVIRKLLEEVLEAARESRVRVKCLERTDDDEPTGEIAVAKNNAAAWTALQSGSANVVGATSWFWAPRDSFGAVDVLFIDEAGQMALADVIAVAHAAADLVLIGDPQQLERPLKGSHPPGAEKSALEHLLEGRKTILESCGLLLPETWRLHPNICAFTSELFYDARLAARDLTRNRVLAGHPWLDGAGLWFVPVAHEGNRNSSPEEVDVVARIVDSLLHPEVRWFYGIGNSRTLKDEDILIVAPYNAQVSDLISRLPNARVGTVDKFQGQQAPVVIYSLATSSPADAPRGMEFLFSLNRFNVATSRGQTAVIVVGNPRLFEPDCRSPRQMQLANAFCRYSEMARAIDPALIR